MPCLLAEPDIDTLESLSAGGMLWFSDLMQSDFILPVMVGLVNLALVEVGLLILLNVFMCHLPA